MKLSHKEFVVIFCIVIIFVIIALYELVLVVLQPCEVSAIINKVTVIIDGFNSGSGVVIYKNENDDIYQIITAWHVIKHIFRNHNCHNLLLRN